MYKINTIGLLSWCVINFCDLGVWICDFTNVMQLMRCTYFRISGKICNFVFVN